MKPSEEKLSQVGHTGAITMLVASSASRIAHYCTQSADFNSESFVFVNKFRIHFEVIIYIFSFFDLLNIHFTYEYMD